MFVLFSLLPEGGDNISHSRVKYVIVISERKKKESKKSLKIFTDVYVSIEASRPHQSWIQDISPIGASQNDHVGATVEACKENRRNSNVRPGMGERRKQREK